MTWLRRTTSGLFVVALLAVALAAAADAASPSPAPTGSISSLSPASGPAGGAFSVTYRVFGGPPCGSAGTVEIHWNSPTGTLLGSLPSNNSCSTTFVTLHPPAGTPPGSYTVWGLRVKGNPPTQAPGSRASTTYSVSAAPSPSPSPSASPPRPTPTPAPTSRPTPTATSPTPIAATSTHGPVVAASSTQQPPAPAANPGPAAPLTECAPGTCPAHPPAATRRRLGTAVPSPVGKSGVATLGIALLPLAGVLLALIGRSRRSDSAGATEALQPPSTDPVALDPVLPSPSSREIYRAQVRAPRFEAQATEEILPRGLFPASPADTAVINPPAADDGLPSMAPAPPRK